MRAAGCSAGAAPPCGGVCRWPRTAEAMPCADAGLRCDERFEPGSNDAVWMSMLSTCLAMASPRCAWTAMRSAGGVAYLSELAALVSRDEWSQHDATALRWCYPALGPSSPEPMLSQPRLARASIARVRLSPGTPSVIRLEGRRPPRSAAPIVPSMAGSSDASVLEVPSLLPNAGPWGRLTQRRWHGLQTLGCNHAPGPHARTAGRCSSTRLCCASGGHRLRCRIGHVGWHHGCPYRCW